MIKKYIVVSLIVSIITSVMFYGLIKMMGAGVGGTSNFDAITLTDGFTLGSGGTSVSKFIAPANCTIIANANTITASTTKDVDCAVTGLVSTDSVFAVATTSVSSSQLGLEIIASRASTTAGYATLTLSNGTGGTFTWTGTASTSFKVFGVR